ncbi:hypothetical protein [Pedobacter sp. L105]|uniref:hypothetical protein n=1 Tax=Pedobacter sp. L105 TaxID=1641871 RepID=UPI00131BD0ED|nr:hypothetical protein [Pedobacter sp. L105]
MTIKPLLMSKHARLFIQVILFFFGFNRVLGQNLLNRSISITARQTKLTTVLNEISAKGGFYFSYNGSIIPQDSVVTLVASNQPISVLLHQLFKDRYEYEERKNHIIITTVLGHLSFLNPDLTVDGKSYIVSGIVVNENTGEHLMNTSVYEKEQLSSTLTDRQGYFRLKLNKDYHGEIVVTLSKIFYRDTTLHFLEPVLINSRPDRKNYSNAAHPGNHVEQTGIGRLLISTRQMIQSMNIPDFFAKRPFQVSLTPGLSTHGMFSPQVVNKFSLNLAGGYTAGVNGLEVGGLFNINKGDSKYFQLAGIFNLVGGNVTGLQFAGVDNKVLDTVKGAQVALFTNSTGEQLSGVQISALHNQTRHLKGLQVGLVNVADVSDGASIGLLNIIGNGFYRVTWSANNISNSNFALKTGTHNFYSELLISTNISANKKFYAFGLGIGHDFILNDKLYVSAETNYQIASTGLWDDRWSQGKLLLNFQLTKNISLLAGPTINHYDHSGEYSEGYENITNSTSHSDDFDANHQSRNWVGFETGIAFNSVFKPAKRAIDHSQNWYLGFYGTEGIGWDKPYKLVSGGELSLERALGGQLMGILSTGYTYFSVQKNYVIGSIGSNDIYAQPVKVFPVKAGIRLMTGGNFFIASEIGEGFGTGQPQLINNNFQQIKTSFHSFIYSASVGYTFKSGVETGIKFEDYSLQSQYKQFAFRLGYRLKLNK